MKNKIKKLKKSKKVIEQMPGNVASGDETDFLRVGGYWPSYNVPFFKEIYEISGNKAAADKYGPSQSYELCPRAKIFRRDAPHVATFEQYRDILRYVCSLHICNMFPNVSHVF